MSKRTTTTVSTTTTVTIDWDELCDLLRKHCGAPEIAAVEVDEWSRATIAWTVTEYDDGGEA